MMLKQLDTESDSREALQQQRVWIWRVRTQEHSDTYSLSADMTSTSYLENLVWYRKLVIQYVTGQHLSYEILAMGRPFKQLFDI
jgi:hypothetical protein